MLRPSPRPETVKEPGIAVKGLQRMQLLEAAHMGLGVTGARLALVNLVARRGWGGPPN